MDKNTKRVTRKKEKGTRTLIIRGLALSEAVDIAEHYGGGMMWDTKENGDMVSYPSNLPCEITTQQIETRNKDVV
jgi:hypothetical protein